MSGPVTAARQLVVVSVQNYGDGDEDFSRAVAAQVSVVTDWLAGPDLPDADRFTLSRPVELEQSRDLRRFLLEADLAATGHDEALVVYITGHGVTSAANHHYLTFAATDPHRLVGTAFPTRELIGAVLDSEAEHVLVLVDSCFAGALGAEVAALVNDLAAVRRKLPTLAVITSGDVHERPYVGEFTKLIALSLEKAADEASGYVDSHLSLADWERLLVEVGGEHPELIEPVWVWPRSRRAVLSACLPNPAYRPVEPVVGAAREEVSLSRETLQYWISRASGRAGEDDAGWYFSGRGVLMRELVGFVRDGHGVLVVTGAAGSGKSGLLARLVTLSDRVFLDLPDFRDVLARVPESVRPGAGAIDAAVLARAKSSLGLIEDLLRAFGHAGPCGDRPPLQILLGLVGKRSAMLGRPVTVVIDGLDEASEPLACISDVVVPLARYRGGDGAAAVRLLLGLRSSSPSCGDAVRGLRDERADRLLTGLQEALEDADVQQPVGCRLLRTDQPDSTKDIAAYTRALLMGAERSPYRTEPAAAAATAQLIAQAVWPSFLDARLAAAQLRAAGRVQDLGDQAWQSRLDSGTAALLRADIRHVARDHQVREDVLLAVLRATAFAFGSGLSWAEVWPAAVRGVLGPDAPDDAEIGEAIRTVHASRLAGYLAHDVQDGRATYRPVHQRVAETLLNAPASLLTEDSTVTARHGGLEGHQRTHRRIALELARLARVAAPLPAHPYVQRYLLAHADAGQVLDDEHVPAELLAQETSGTLRARLRLPLPVHDIGRPTLIAAALIEPYVDATIDYVSRLASIAFQRAALSDLAEEQGTLPLPEADFLPHQPVWTTAWSRWQSRTNVLAAVRGMVHGVCAFRTAEDRDLLAVASGAGVDVWDSATGQRLTHIRVAHTRDLVLLAGRGGRMFLVTAAWEGVAVWDPLSGLCVASLPVSGPGTPRPRAVRVVRDGEEKWIIAILAGRRIWMWRPDEDKAQELPHEVPPARAKDFVVVRGDHASSVLAYPAPGRHGVTVCAPLSAGTWELAMPSQVPIHALASVRGPGEHDVLVTSGLHSDRYVWDPYSGRQLAAPVWGAEDLYALAGPDGRLKLGTSYGGRLRIRDLAQSLTGDQLLGTVPGDAVHAVTAVPASTDRPWTVVTAGEGGIRLTVPETAPRSLTAGPGRRGRRAAASSSPALHSLQLLQSPSTPDLLAGVRSGTAVLLDADTGRMVSKLPGWPVQRLEPFAAQGPDSQLLAVQTDDRITVWDLHARHTVGTVPLIGRTRWCTTMLADHTHGLVLAGVRGLELFTSSGDLVWRTTPTPLRTLRGWPLGAPCVWQPDPRRGPVIVTAANNSLMVFDQGSGQLLNEQRIPRRGSSRAMICVPRPAQGPLLAMASGHHISLWDSAFEMVTFDAPAPVAALAAVSPPGQRPMLAVGCGSGVQLWDVQTREVVHTLLTAAPVTGLVHRHVGGDHRMWITGPAGVAALAVRLSPA